MTKDSSHPDQQTIHSADGFIHIEPLQTSLRLQAHLRIVMAVPPVVLA